jgi:rRNA processing protein Krr1/Pno1
MAALILPLISNKNVAVYDSTVGVIGRLLQSDVAKVALKALEEFEGNMKMEQRPDGSVDSFRSSRNRSRWQYATCVSSNVNTRPECIESLAALRTQP